MRNRELLLNRLSQAEGKLKRINSILNSRNITKEDISHSVGEALEIINECMDITNREEINLK